MIFDKYIAIIVEKIERHAAIIINEVKDENKILQSEIGALHAKFDNRNELFEKIVKLEEKNLELERENRTLMDVAEDANREHEEVNEKWESLSESFRELEEGYEKMCEETFERENIASTRLNEQRATIAQLEKKVQSSDNALKDATRASTEAQDRLIQAVKAYDKATVSMLNAFIEKKDVTKPRADWEKAKEDLKGWDKPKKGRKKQS